MKASPQYQPLVQPKTFPSVAATPFFAQSRTGTFFGPAVPAPFFKPFVQPKLTVGRADDPYEREADATADRVLRIPAPHSPTAPAPPLLQPKMEEKEKKDLRKKEDPLLLPQVRLKVDEEEKKKLRKKAEAAAPPVSAGFESQLAASQSGGQPMGADTRQFMEPRFGADFSAVRIHTDAPAVQLSQQIGAQAFAFQNHLYFNTGRYSPGTSEGRHLLAHELTHVIQQGGAVQRQPLVSAIAPTVQRLFGIDVAGRIDGWLDNLPGWRLLTVLIEYNPVLQQRVPRTTENVIEGFLKLGGPIGVLLFNKLRDEGIVGRAASWINTQLASLGISFSYIQGLFRQAWDEMGIRHGISGNIAIIRRIFSVPFNRITAFVSRVVSQVVTFIKETIVRPLSNRAKQMRGFPLLTVIIGKDPFTDEEVDRSPSNLVRGFMSLMENGEERFRQMQQSGALQRAFGWFNEETSKRNLTWARIKGTFLAAWNLLTPAAVLRPLEVITQIIGLFSGLAADLLGFAGSALLKMLELIFEAVMGAGGARVLAVLKRARDTFNIIIRDPVRFVGNLVRAGVLGFRQFMQNALGHLQRGVVGWLLGALAGAGLQLPAQFNLQGILSLVLQILGLTYQNIRAKLVRATNEQFVSRLEQVFDFLRILVTQGPAAAWQKILEYLGNLRDLVLGGIISWVRQTVIGQAVIRIASMLNPAGAVIQAIIATYNTVMFFIERINQVAAVVESYVNSIAAIASGNIVAAANRVEQTMGRTVPVIISFLARLIGLGGISNAIRNTIARVRQPVDRALDRVVTWVVAQGRRLVGAVVGAGQRVAGAVLGFFGVRTRFASNTGESHSLYFTQRDGQPVLTIESRPQDIDQFLNFYVTEYEIQPSSDKGRLVQEIRTFLGTYQPLYRNLARLGAESAAAQPIHQQLLAKNVQLSEKLRRLISGNRTVGQIIDSYQLEGLTGTYASMPRARTDILTPDHQPQAAILVWAANVQVGGRRLFSSSSEMARRASGGHASHGYAINLHENRHTEGRTYGSRGNATLNSFISFVQPRINSATSDQQRRDIIVDRMKSELQQDVNVMVSVLNRRNVWTDITDITDLNATQKRTLKNGIIARIQQGEREISNQPMDSLKAG